MAIYELMKDTIRSIETKSFATLGINERADLQRLLRIQIETISPDLLVIAEEFCEWEDSKRRIDLLGLDKDANLVVIELKRTEDGGHMELQAIRYAAMVSAMTFERAVAVYASYLHAIGSTLDARQSILEFLEWEEANEDQFAQDVRIVLVSAEFSKELTTAVMWLNDRDLDIRCVRIKPYSDNGRVLIDVQQVIPLPEATDYQVQLREKEKQVRKDRRGGGSRLTRQWDEVSFFAELEKQHGVVAVETARTILDWARPNAEAIGFGSGQMSGSVYPLFDKEGRRQLFILWTSGRISFAFGAMKKFPPFNDDSKRRELFRSLNQISAIPPDGMDKFPSIPLDVLANKVAMDQFLAAMDWAVNEILGK